MNKIHKTILFVNTLVIIIITTLLPIIQLIKDIVQSEKPSSKNPSSKNPSSNRYLIRACILLILIPLHIYLLYPSLKGKLSLFTIIYIS